MIETQSLVVSVFAVLGVILTVATVGFIIFGSVIAFKEWIIVKRYQYRYKHRFDKLPTAKCYCRDCIKHCDDDGRCVKFEGWKTADNWFCWNATPRVAWQEKGGATHD